MVGQLVPGYFPLVQDVLGAVRQQHGLAHRPGFRNLVRLLPVFPRREDTPTFRVCQRPHSHQRRHRLARDFFSRKLHACQDTVRTLPNTDGLWDGADGSAQPSVRSDRVLQKVCATVHQTTADRSQQTFVFVFHYHASGNVDGQHRGLPGTFQQSATYVRYPVNKSHRPQGTTSQAVDSGTVAPSALCGPKSCASDPQWPPEWAPQRPKPARRGLGAEQA